MNNTDNRFSVILSYVNNSSIAADIGSDHGKLAVLLIQQGKASHVYATDINIKPLEKTILAVKKYGLSEFITPILTDGLSGMDDLPLTDIIIAGMGGENISSIIEKCAFFRHDINFVLQPMTRAGELRKFLYSKNFNIISETLVEDNNRIYPIIKTSFDGVSRAYSPVDLVLGRFNIENRKALPALFDKYASRKLAIARSRRNGRKIVGLDTKDDDVLIEMIEAILEIK